MLKSYPEDIFELLGAAGVYFLIFVWLCQKGRVSQGAVHKMPQCSFGGIPIIRGHSGLFEGVQ